MKLLNFIPGLFLTGVLCLTLSVSAQTNIPTNSSLIKQAKPLTNTLDHIDKLNPVTFEYDKDQIMKLKLPSGKQYGFIADEVYKIMPELVKSMNKMVPAGKNSFKNVEVKNVDMNSIITLLVASLKEQQTEIDKLKADVQSLRSMTAQ